MGGRVTFHITTSLLFKIFCTYICYFLNFKKIRKIKIKNLEVEVSITWPLYKYHIFMIWQWPINYTKVLKTITKLHITISHLHICPPQHKK